MAVDWSLWGDVSQTELWRAVALSLGYDPFALPGYHHQIPHAPFNDCPDEFQRRLFIARSHIGSSLKAQVRPDKPLWDAFVELTVLRAWAVSLQIPWSFPAQYPRAIGVPSRETLDHEVTVSPKHSKGWFEVAGDYVVDIQRTKRYGKAKDLYNALLHAAKAQSGPFRVGEGDSRGSLVMTQTGKTLRLKTLANRWPEIRRQAQKAP